MGPPAFPADALAKKQTGKVVIQLLVGADGKVKDLKIEKPSPIATFNNAATAAARKWTFRPATTHGKPVEEWVRVPVEFKA